jgi:hypothetical protein
MLDEEAFARELVAMIRQEIAASVRPQLERIAELEFQVRAMKAKEIGRRRYRVAWPWAAQICAARQGRSLKDADVARTRHARSDRHVN